MDLLQGSRDKKEFTWIVAMPIGSICTGRKVKE